MNPPKWTRGGAFAPTATGTVISLIAAPIAGLGLLALAFKAVSAGLVLTAVGAALWLIGRWLLDR